MLKDNFNVIVKPAVKNFPKEFLNQVADEFKGGTIGEIAGEIYGDLVKENLKKKEKLGKYINGMSLTYDEKISSEDAEKVKSRIKKELEEKRIEIKKKQEGKEKKLQETMKSKEVSKTLSNTAITKENFSVDSMSVEKLREAVIWSEVIGEPVCRRRRNQRRSCGGHTCR